MTRYQRPSQFLHYARWPRMPKVSFIVARTKDGVIGRENAMPWRLGSDLKRFRKITSEKVVVMGRRTFDSIGRALPNRINIVVTRSNDFYADDTIICSDLRSAIFLADVKSIGIGAEEFFVIGGEQIFRELESFVERVYLTEIDVKGLSGDTHFDLSFKSGWKKSEHLKISRSELDDYDYSFIVFERTRRRQSRQSTPSRNSGRNSSYHNKKFV